MWDEKLFRVVEVESEVVEGRKGVRRKWAICTRAPKQTLLAYALRLCLQAAVNDGESEDPSTLFQTSGVMAW